jgi:predicted glycogen debranching enzyme
MIALNGLTLATGRHEIARGILLEFSKHISQGMLPTVFPTRAARRNTTRSMRRSGISKPVRAYLAKTGDLEFVREYLYLKLADILAWHLRGTRFKIHVDTDGLLYAGEPGVQLTWMDAKIGDLVITPRTGKPVEIQALWYNALRFMAELAARFEDEEDRQALCCDGRSREAQL